MQEDANDWFHFWESKTEEWLEGYCFAEGTTWWCRYDTEISMHHHRNEIVWTWFELGEEE